MYVTESLSGLTDYPTIVIPADSSLTFQFVLQSTLIPKEWNNCYVAVTSVDKENNESQPSNIVMLEKTSEGWQVKK